MSYYLLENKISGCQSKFMFHWFKKLPLNRTNKKIQ
jgi:hypothetical protein